MGNTNSASSSERLHSPTSHRTSKLMDPPSAPPPYADVVGTSPHTYSYEFAGTPSPELHGSFHTRVYDNILSIPPPRGSDSAAPRGHHRESAENALEMLRKFNTVILVDDSGSMRGALWKEARNALASLAHAASKYDTDGIDVHFLNSKNSGIGMKSSAEVKQLFDSVRPRGATPIGEKLEELLLEYLSMLDDAKDTGDLAVIKTIKPVNYIILTDGAPTDDPETVIVTAAKRLDSRNYPLTQVGIQFVQIGSSEVATNFLNELDDTLAPSNGIRDMVDTTPYTGGPLSSESLIKILLGGINRRVDRRGAESVL